MTKKFIFKGRQQQCREEAVFGKNINKMLLQIILYHFLIYLDIWHLFRKIEREGDKDTDCSNRFQGEKPARCTVNSFTLQGLPLTQLTPKPHSQTELPSQMGLWNYTVYSRDICKTSWIFGWLVSIFTWIYESTPNFML